MKKKIFQANCKDFIVDSVNRIGQNISEWYVLHRDEATNRFHYWINLWFSSFKINFITGIESKIFLFNESLFSIYKIISIPNALL